MKAKAGSYDANKRTKVLEQLENMVERPALIKFVSEHIQPSEVDKLLATPESSSKAQAPRTEPKKKKEVLPPMPSPDQMRQQAIMMRKNPEMVRRSNAALAGFSDAQIFEYADQLEKAAKDPEMLKEIMKVSRLSTDDRDRLQKFQEGLSGARPMDAAWIDLTVDTLRNRNEILKTLFHGRGAMFGGVTDEQIDSFLDMLARQEAWVLKLLVQTMLFLGSLVKPISEYYQRIDKATLGLAAYVLGAIAVFLLYMYIRGTWWVIMFVYRLVFVGAASAATAATATATVNTASVAGGVASGASNVASATLAAGIAAAGAKAAVDAASSGASATIAQAARNSKASLDEDF